MKASGIGLSDISSGAKVLERRGGKDIRVESKFSKFGSDSFLLKKGDRSSLVGFLLRHQINAAVTAHGIPGHPVPFVQFGGNLLHLRRHSLEIPLSAALNGVGAFKRDHIAMPVGACRAGRRLCPPDRYDLVGMPHC